MKKYKYTETPNTLLADMMVLIIMVTAIVYAFLSYMELKPSSISIFFIVSILSALSYAFFYNAKSIAIFSGITCIYLISALIGFPRFLNSSSVFFNWLIRAILYGDIYVFAEHAAGFSLFIIITFTLLYYLLVIKLRKFLLYTIVTVSIFIYLNIGEYDISARKVTITAFFIVMFAILYFYISNRYRVISTFNEFIQNKISYGKWHKYTIPFISCALILTIIMMPSDISMNLRNENLYNFIAQLRENIDDYLNQSHKGLNGKFDLSQTGFSRSPSSNLGGPVRISTNHVFDVNTKSPVYLRGAVYDMYTGHTWTNNIKVDGTPFTSSNTLDFKDIFAMDDLRKYDIYNIYNRRELKISKIDIRTTTVFNTTFVTNASIDDTNNKLFYNKRSEMYSNKNISDKSYTLSYCEYDYTNSNLQQLMKTDAINYSINTDVTKNISKYYLQLPDNFPGVVTSLAKDVTKYTSNQYSKCLMIMDFLKNNYKYSLSPAVAPENIDFAQNFLFNERAGYCTYFATAMTVMCRSINIPARYVTGFRVDSIGTKVSVCDYNAHAWTEVYFPNIGWVPFDPVTRQDFRSNDPGSHGSGPAENPHQTPKPTIKPPAKTPSSTETENNTPTIAPEKTARPSGNNIFSSLLPLFLLIIISFIAGFMFLYPKLFKKNKLKRPSVRNHLLDMLNRDLEILKGLNINMDDGETIYMFFKKLDKVLRQAEELIKVYVPSKQIETVKLETVGYLFELGFYSDYKLSKDDIEYLNLFNKRIAQDLLITKQYYEEKKKGEK